jgi:hypothetical protein
MTHLRELLPANTFRATPQRSVYGAVANLREFTHIFSTVRLFCTLS